MTDYDVTLLDGEQILIRNGPKKPTGWIKRNTVTRNGGDTVHVRLIDTTTPEEPPEEPEEPAPSTGAVGYGRLVVGGTTPFDVRTEADLRNALPNAAGRIVNMKGSGEWKLGKSLPLPPHASLNGEGYNVVLRDGSILVSGEDNALHHVRMRIGDLVGSADSLRAVTAGKYHSTTPKRGLLVSHCEFAWAPDVNFSTFSELDVTFQYTAFYEALLHSNHSQSGDATGHGLGHALMGAKGGEYGGRTTIYRCLYHANESRNPRLTGVGSVDIIESAITGYHEGPQGAVFSLNMLGVTLYPSDTAKRSGLPDTQQGPFIRQAFRNTPNTGEKDTSEPASVYVDDLNAVGFVPLPHDNAAENPKVAPNLTGITRKPAATAFDEMLKQVGAHPRDVTMTRIAEEARTGKGIYVNGTVYPPTPAR